MLPIRTILHPTDFSDYSENAFHLACTLARDHGSQLIVLHVVEPPVPIYGNGLVVPPARASKEALRSKLCDLLPRDPKLQAEDRLVEGDAATEILRFARQAGCDLIVMRTHGRTGLGRLQSGIAEALIELAASVESLHVPRRDHEM